MKTGIVIRIVIALAQKTAMSTNMVYSCKPQFHISSQWPFCRCKISFQAVEDGRNSNLGVNEEIDHLQVQYNEDHD